MSALADITAPDTSRAARHRALRAAGYRGSKARNRRTKADAQRVVDQVRAQVRAAIESAASGDAQ